MKSHRSLVAWAIASWLVLLIPASVGASESGIAVPDAAKRVVIRRTAYGVPHIKADTEADVAFGFGYCQAEDHALSIMRLILAARGERAKYFGKEYTNSDFSSRQFRIYARAQENYHRHALEFREMLEAFAAGFNYHNALHRSELPDWVRPINGQEVAAHGLAGVMRFAFNRGNIISSFLGKQKKESAILAPDETEAEALMGSNMWALGPSRTASGKAILMGNPHQGWAEVSTYYEAHITVPGKINFYGSTFVGRPILTSGFNENLGWSHTVNYPDLEEIYELTIDPKESAHYLFDGSSIPIRKEEVTVEIKDGESMRSEKRTFEHTPIGPVILRTEAKIYVLRSACYENPQAYEEWYALSKSRNFQEFRHTLDMMAVPMFNICYADREGNIFYLWNGMVPVLPHEAQTDKAVPASRSAEIWTRFHPVSELPQLFNPKGGYVQNCNDPPYFTNLREVIDWKRYPAYFGAPRLGLRTQHSLALVDGDKKFSLEDVRDLKFSQRMLAAERFKDDLIALVEAHHPDEETRSALELLKKWDNSTSAESKGSTLFAAWFQKYALSGPAAFRSEAFEVKWSPDDPVNTPRGFSQKDQALSDFRFAMEQTKRNFGSWDVSWGDVHRVRRGSVDAPVGGGSGFIGAFRVLDFKKDSDGKYVVNGGDSWIFTVEFGDTPRGYSVVGYSQSEFESSPYYNDQTPLFAANQMKKIAFTEPEIQAQLEKSYHPGEEGK